MTYNKLMELVATLAGLAAGGEAHHAFRQSIINDMQLHAGYSAARAGQVVDALERSARRTLQ